MPQVTVLEAVDHVMTVVSWIVFYLLVAAVTFIIANFLLVVRASIIEELPDPPTTSQDPTPAYQPNVPTGRPAWLEEEMALMELEKEKARWARLQARDAEKFGRTARLQFKKPSARSIVTQHMTERDRSSEGLADILLATDRNGVVLDYRMAGEYNGRSPRVSAGVGVGFEKSVSPLNVWAQGPDDDGTQEVARWFT